jgi:RNA polymerase sigma factor (sigma-70 family)
VSPRLTAEQQALCASVPRLVSRLAKRHAGRTPSVDRSDFESAGDEALVACTLDYRPEDGSFEEHALARVDYAMRDVARKAMKIFTRERPRREQLRPARREDFDTPEEATAAMFAEADMPPRARLLRDLELQAAAFTAAELEQEERAAVDVVETQHRALELRALRAAVEELEARERAVYEAIYREDRQVNEIAEALGVDRRTISRITERIREHVAVRLRPLLA